MSLGRYDVMQGKYALMTQILDSKHFEGFIPSSYDDCWYAVDGKREAVLEDSIFSRDIDNTS